MGEHDRCLCKKTLAPGERFLVISTLINWGDNDDRADWTGEKSFCSFACLKDWAAEMSAAHDSRVVA